MQFHCGVGLGLLLSRLYQEQFSEISGICGHTIMLKSLNTLENILYDSTVLEKEGPIIGYGIAMSSLLSHDVRKDSKVHAILAYEKLLHKCQELSEEDVNTVTGQAFCFALACVSMHAFGAATVDVNTIHECLDLIQKYILKASQVNMSTKLSF